MLMKMAWAENKTRISLWSYSALFAAAFVVCYGSVAANMAAGWWEIEAYSHGFLIIPISLFLVWNNKRALQSLPIRPNLIGGAIAVMLAGALLIIGRIGTLNILEDVSLIFMIPAFVLFLLGRTYLAALMFPLCYLVFTLPFFELIGDGIYWPFQLFSAKIGSDLLNFFGYAAYLSGQYIELPHITLDIAEECAGIRYLISILAIGTPLSYLYLQNGLKRILFVGTAILIAILSNGLRVMLVGVTAYRGHDIHGPFHVFQGMFVAWIGFLVLFIEVWCLSKRGMDSSADFSAISCGPKDLTLFVDKPASMERGLLLGTGILLFLGAALHYYVPKPVPFNEAIFSSLTQVGSFSGTDDDLNGHPFRIQGADSEKGMVYSDKEKDPLYLYIGYFPIQRRGKELVGYASSALHKNAVEIPVGAIRVNKTIVNDTRTNHVVLFWYDFNGQSVANRYYAKGLSIWNAVWSRRNNGTLIVISHPLSRYDNEAQILNREILLVETLLPALRGK